MSQHGARIMGGGAMTPTPTRVRRRGRSSGVPAPACGRARRLPRPSRSPDAPPCASATRPRSRACTGRSRPRPGRVSCSRTPSAMPSAPGRRCAGGGGRAASAHFRPSGGHGSRARRDEVAAVGVAPADASVNAVLVVSAVAREGGYRARHLVEQGAGLVAVVNLAGGQRRGDDLPGVGVHTEVEFPPGPSRLGAVFLDQPFAGPTQLQARAVHQQMHGLGLAPSIGCGRPRPGHLHGCGPPAQGGVARYREIETKQADEGADQALRSAGTPDGTQRGGSGPSGWRAPNTRAAHPGSCGAQAPTRRPPPR